MKVSCAGVILDPMGLSPVVETLEEIIMQHEDARLKTGVRHDRGVIEGNLSLKDEQRKGGKVNTPGKK